MQHSFKSKYLKNNDFFQMPFRKKEEGGNFFSKYM